MDLCTVCAEGVDRAAKQGFKGAPVTQQEGGGVCVGAAGSLHIPCRYGAAGLQGRTCGAHVQAVKNAMRFWLLKHVRLTTTALRTLNGHAVLQGMLSGILFSRVSCERVQVCW